MNESHSSQQAVQTLSGKRSQSTEQLGVIQWQLSMKNLFYFVNKQN
jgi:hypothetical protein